MKSMIVGGAIVFALCLLAQQTAHSQGTVYVSNLGQPSSGSLAVGNDSWQAEMFVTGNNPGGYALDSVQLAMTAGSGAPNAFSVMIYSAGGVLAPAPGSLLGTLSGSTDPVAGGLFTYNSSGVTLHPSADYFIVVTAGTSVANGAFAWSVENTSPPVSSGGWSPYYFPVTSTDGLSWNNVAGLPQLAVTATTVPEPETLYLIGLPGLLFVAWHRRHGKEHATIGR